MAKAGAGKLKMKRVRDKQWKNTQKSLKSTFGGGHRRKKGCYVATCVYGSYDCPEVWVLRRYRDEVLDGTILGKIFIIVYYAVSPMLVKALGKSNLIRKLWKNKLDKWVQELENQGYSDLPYNDKY